MLCPMVKLTENEIEWLAKAINSNDDSYQDHANAIIGRIRDEAENPIVWGPRRDMGMAMPDE
jgi:hypothetical protein